MSETAANHRSPAETEHSDAVREMFSGIASKYDFMNHFLSLNIDKRWRKKVARMLKDVRRDPEALILDVACGTGDLALELQNDANARVVGTDFCRPMLEIAREKNASLKQTVPYLEADGLKLSFDDDTFDAIAIAFGLRNFSNWRDGLKEMLRVLKTDGRLIVLEFSSPSIPGFREAFQFYFKNILPKIGGAISGSRGAYEYLPDSVSRFPDQEGLAGLMRQIGFSDVKYQNLTGGIAAIHSGTKSLNS